MARLEVIAKGDGWLDLEDLGELYRWDIARRLVIGPDGAEYDAISWFEERGIDESLLQEQEAAL